MTKNAQTIQFPHPEQELKNNPMSPREIHLIQSSHALKESTSTQLRTLYYQEQTKPINSSTAE